jgi:hypothetical protein
MDPAHVFSYLTTGPGRQAKQLLVALGDSWIICELLCRAPLRKMLKGDADVLRLCRQVERWLPAAGYDPPVLCSKNSPRFASA